MPPSQGSEIFAPKTEAFDLSQCELVLRDLSSIGEKFRSVQPGTEACVPR